MELCFHGFSHYARKIIIIYYALARGDTIHFVVIMEPQSSENCAFFVLASVRKYNKIHEYPHTKVSMHSRDQPGKEKTLLLLLIS